MQNPKRRALKNIYCLLLYEYVDKRKNGKKINDIDILCLEKPYSFLLRLILELVRCKQLLVNVVQFIEKRDS